MLKAHMHASIRQSLTRRKHACIYRIKKGTDPFFSKEDGVLFITCLYVGSFPKLKKMHAAIRRRLYHSPLLTSSYLYRHLKAKPTKHGENKVGNHIWYFSVVCFYNFCLLILLFPASYPINFTGPAAEARHSRTWHYWKLVPSITV